MRGLPFLLLLLPLQQSSGVDEIVAKALRESKLRDPKLGLVVLSPKGETLCRRGESEALILASNTKLLTTSCALAKLGADFTFKTTVGLIGSELHVFGGGDPNISGRFHDDDPSAVFKGWAAKVGVKKLDAVVLHPGLFDRTYLHPDWEGQDESEWWCAPVGALSLNDNCVDVLYEGGDEGAPAKITLRPDTGYVTVKNTSASTKAPKKPFVIYRKKGTNDLVVSGEIKAGAKQQVKWVAIHDPTRYFGTVLKETLEKAGIEVGAMKEADTLLGDHADLKVVAVHESDLARTLQVCNRSSQNFYAEMLCKTLGSKVVGAGTTAAGVATIATWLQSIGIEDADLSDGSGLSRKNRCSAASLAKLLAWWTSQKDFKIFHDSLPVSGTDGTLKRRMESVAGKVRAKTGHINGVSSLSGYVDTAGGRVAFSILVNGWKGGSADGFQDAVCEGLVPWK